MIKEESTSNLFAHRDSGGNVGPTVRPVLLIRFRINTRGRAATEAG